MILITIQHIHNVDHNLDHLDHLQGQYWGCLAAQLDAARLSHFECWGRERVGEERLREVVVIIIAIVIVVISGEREFPFPVIPKNGGL